MPSRLAKPKTCIALWPRRAFACFLALTPSDCPANIDVLPPHMQLIKFAIFQLWPSRFWFWFCGGMNVAEAFFVLCYLFLNAW